MFSFARPAYCQRSRSAIPTATGDPGLFLFFAPPPAAASWARKKRRIPDAEKVVSFFSCFLRNSPLASRLVPPESLANPRFSRFLPSHPALSRVSQLSCLFTVGGSETAALFDFLVSHRVDGILLVSASSAAPDLLRRHARGTPSVLLGDVSPTATLQRINAVSTDNYVGGAMAAGYLSRLGHRRVLYLGPRRDSVTHVLRHQGFLTIARERGMEVETVFNPGAVSSAPNGYRLARQVFARPFPQTAVFAPSDAMALGVLQAADELGLDIPGRISLLGYDDIEYASLPKIRLSTLAQPTGALAESAVRLLLELIDSGGPGEVTHKLIAPRLVERSTCCSPQQRTAV